MKVYIKTYGCQMNQRDSDALAAQLVANGHTMVEIENDADIILFNTCSVRDAAERKAKGKIGYMKKLKDKKPNLILGVMGCMAQRLGDELLAELPHLDFVLGTGQLHQLVDTVDKITKERCRLTRVEESADVLTNLDGHYTTDCCAEIAITRGCNRFCSYCIVPYVRGREISREKEDIIKEAKELAAKGVKEILLLGQNVAAYGLGGDIRPPKDGYSPFADLLEELNQIDGILRIRFTSPYISYFNDRLIEAIAKCSKVCNNLHLPVQSGSNTILKAMNRQYTRESYLEKVAQLKAAIPNLTLSTDVIVGFPGETDEDFALTRSLLNEVGFEQSYIFKYSPRPGAKSAALEDSVPEEVKEERNQILLADLANRVENKIANLNGQVLEVLVEGVSPRNTERWSGRTTTNYHVHFEPVPNLKVGEIRKVEITFTGSVSLIGKIVD